MFLDASAGGSVQNKTPTEVEELIQNMCQNQYNKVENDEEILEQLEEKEQKEQRINTLQKEEDLQKEKQFEEQKTQAAWLEVMMIQLTKVIGEHMQSARAEMQHLAREVSSIKEEQSKAIELRNRKVDIAEKPKEDKKSKASEAGDNPTKETIEEEDAVEKEPTAHKGSQPTPPP
ncbi:hypothetical protein A2U01_0032822, partial [Trifolium medium]|nr:hypothetical protein [Trifolium medium]